jgi:hypothetical protein
MTRMQRINTDYLLPIGEVFRSLSKRSWLIVLYMVIPVVFLMNATTIHSNLGKLFMNNVDPEFFYLYNGMQMSRGTLSMQYTSNPGTPLQAVVAVACDIVGAFQSGDVLKDMVNDPEKYIHASNLLMVFLIAVALFFCGWYVRKISGSWFAGLLVQFSLPGSASLLYLTGRVNAEAMLVLPVLLLCIAIFHYIFTDQEQDKASGKMTALFGLILGFGGAVKISFFPLIIIPWILLRSSFWEKVKLLLYTLLFFAIFAYPVVFNNGNFWNWLASVLSHTGKYGEGPKGFIDLAAIPGHLSTLYHDDKLFFFITGLSLLLGAWFWLQDLKSSTSVVAGRLVRAMIAVPVAIIACMVLVLKHFELYYFVPFYAFKFVMIALLLLMLFQNRFIKETGIGKTVATIVFAAVVIVITFGQAQKVQAYNQHFIQRKALQDLEYAQVMAQFEPGSPLILSGAYYGTPFIEFAHYDGYKMAGKIKGSYTPYLRERFPVSYQFVNWADKFYFWDTFVDFKEILDKTDKSFYIFLGQWREGDLATIEQRLYQVIDSGSVRKEIVYHNETNGDQLIRMTLERNK